MSPLTFRTHTVIWKKCISVNGIIKLLHGLNPDKAPGPDRIKPLLLQKLCLEIAPILQVIFSRSLDEGSLPPDWLKANVSPVFKKGEKSSTSNYRSISLTCILCRILEHIITSNIVKHFDDSKILYDFQHGFRANMVSMLNDPVRRNSSCM